MDLRSYLASLLGFSQYRDAVARPALELDSPAVERVREVMGGQLSPLPISKTRWYLEEIEEAQRLADLGDMTLVGQLAMAMRSDGTFAGILSALTAGVLSLPQTMRGGSPEIASRLDGSDGRRGALADMCPRAELNALLADAALCGVAVAELVPVPARGFPILRRLDPQFLLYRWNENRWYYRSIVGLVHVDPGDSRWVLHIPGAALCPWQFGLWRQLGRAYVTKAHAVMNKSNWEAKLANPARVAVAPQGATPEQAESWFKRVMAWGVNTVFGLRPGYDVRLLESNGRGWESFTDAIERADREYAIGILGQVVTTDGGAGFSNSDVHRMVRADIIAATAHALADTINAQVLPAWVASQYGVDALPDCPQLEYDTSAPKDQASEANAWLALGNAIKALREAGLEPDLVELSRRYGLPILTVQQVAQNDVTPDPLQEAA